MRLWLESSAHRFHKLAVEGSTCCRAAWRGGEAVQLRETSGSSTSAILQPNFTPPPLLDIEQAYYYFHHFPIAATEAFIPIHQHRLSNYG